MPVRRDASGRFVSGGGATSGGGFSGIGGGSAIAIKTRIQWTPQKLEKQVQLGTIWSLGRAGAYIRGIARKRKGDYDKTVTDYTKAIETDSKLANAYAGLAWFMATCPEGRYRDGKRAVELAEKALNLEETGDILAVLAAAYAEAGRFQEAIETMERAIMKIKQEGRTKDLPNYKELLPSYKAGRPWREK